MAELFLIRKGGYYYRPNARGYTASVHEAGRFPKEEAFAHMDACAPGEIVIFPAPTISVSITVEDDIRVTAEKIVLEHVASGSLNMDNLAGAIAGALEEERAKANTPPPVQHAAPDLTNEQKEITLLRIIEAMGGTTDSSENPHSWLNWFCSDEIHNVQEDTFNRCEAKGWIFTTHNSDWDTSTTKLTESGRAALNSPPSTQTMDDIHREQLDRPRLKPASPQTKTMDDIHREQLDRPRLKPVDGDYVLKSEAWDGCQKSIQRARDKALEEAAKVAEEEVRGITIDVFVFNGTEAKNRQGHTEFVSTKHMKAYLQNRAAAIRAMKSQSPAPEPREVGEA